MDSPRTAFRADEPGDGRASYRICPRCKQRPKYVSPTSGRHYGWCAKCRADAHKLWESTRSAEQNRIKALAHQRERRPGEPIVPKPVGVTLPVAPVMTRPADHAPCARCHSRPRYVGPWSGKVDSLCKECRHEKKHEQYLRRQWRTQEQQLQQEERPAMPYDPFTVIDRPPPDDAEVRTAIEAIAARVEAGGYRDTSPAAETPPAPLQRVPAPFPTEMTERVDAPRRALADAMVLLMSARPSIAAGQIGPVQIALEVDGVLIRLSAERLTTEQ